MRWNPHKFDGITGINFNIFEKSLVNFKNQVVGVLLLAQDLIQIISWKTIRTVLVEKT